MTWTTGPTLKNATLLPIHHRKTYDPDNLSNCATSQPFNSTFFSVDYHNIQDLFSLEQLKTAT